MDPVPRRSYPQGGRRQILGFVGGDLRGYYGVEGHYNDQLAGKVTERREVRSRLTCRLSTGSRIAGATSC